MSASEKDSTTGKEGVDAVHETLGAGASSGEVDAAWQFLDAHREHAEASEPIDMAALRRKIDLRIVPLMFLCYTLQFLDKVILNVRSPPPFPAMALRPPANVPFRI
jgi:hypothetical protein